MEKGLLALLQISYTVGGLLHGYHLNCMRNK